MPSPVLDCTTQANSTVRQWDYHLQPCWVDGGDESFVLVASSTLGNSDPIYINSVKSFLGVMPGDIVEAAVDVVDAETGVVLYTRSMHKECAGIYDAWHKELVGMEVLRLKITVTCRVNDRNRDGNLKAYFEALVRIEQWLS